jgi:hypothetical protein
MGCARPKRELGFLRWLFLHTFLYMTGSLGDESSLESASMWKSIRNLKGSGWWVQGEGGEDEGGHDDLQIYCYTWARSQNPKPRSEPGILNPDVHDLSYVSHP